MAYNIADLFEYTVDAVPDRPALVDRDRVFTFAELEARVNQFARVLLDAGIEPGDRIGIYGINSHQWVTAMLASYKVRAIPVNVNFRYVTDELRYIFDNAELAALVVDGSYLSTAAAVLDGSSVRTVLSIADGAEPADDWPEHADFDSAADSHSTERPELERSPDDIYILYTGGTTGLPKGVMWRQEDVFFALGGGIDALSRTRVTDDHELARRAEANGPLTFLVIPPLMHGAAQWGTLGQMLAGNTIVVMSDFSGENVWDHIDRLGCNSVLITGDAMGRPMIETLEANPDRWNVSSLISVSSSAAIFSPVVKDRFLDRFPNLIITDSIGSSESGFNGLTMVAKGETQVSAGGPTVQPSLDVAILRDDLTIIEPGSDEVGKLARSGNIPIGYWRDEKKSAETFVTAGDGRRYSVPGDFARWGADDTITLLGRGSTTINSGGEKIHAEEVEQVLKAHPAVFDCLVVGAPDERWGQRVTAVVQFRPDVTATLDDLGDHVRGSLAGYKVPRTLIPVDQIVRSPSGKPDYPWAKELAASFAQR